MQNGTEAVSSDFTLSKLTFVGGRKVVYLLHPIGCDQLGAATLVEDVPADVSCLSLGRPPAFDAIQAVYFHCR